MNVIERLAYRLLRRHPHLKIWIRNIYQGAFDFLPSGPQRIPESLVVRPDCFFGFHDHSPFSPDGLRLASNKILSPARMPGPGVELGVGYFDGEDYREFHPVGRTLAWNWQMGCRLQWAGGSRRLAFNDLRADRAISRLIDVLTGQEQVCDVPLSTVSPDGRWAVGYDFGWVEQCMPGYGYPVPVAAPRPALENCPDTHGLHLTDLTTGSSRVLATIRQVAECGESDTSQEARHFVTHTVFSPDGQHVLFLHRWYRGTVYQRVSRLVCVHIPTGRLEVLPPRQMVSHINWRNPREVVAYSRVPGQEDGYYAFRLGDPGWTRVAPELKTDGHPFFEASGRWMLTDTYPDRRSRQKLLLYDTEARRLEVLAELHHPARFRVWSAHRDWACDFHPRLRADGAYACFDSAHTGVRSLCTVRTGLS